MRLFYSKLLPLTVITAVSIMGIKNKKMRMTCVIWGYIIVIAIVFYNCCVNQATATASEPTNQPKQKQQQEKMVRKETTQSLETTLTPLEPRTSNNYSSFDISERFPLWFYTRTRSN